MTRQACGGADASGGASLGENALPPAHRQRPRGAIVGEDAQRVRNRPRGGLHPLLQSAEVEREGVSRSVEGAVLLLKAQEVGIGVAAASETAAAANISVRWVARVRSSPCLLLGCHRLHVTEGVAVRVEASSVLGVGRRVNVVAQGRRLRSGARESGPGDPARATTARIAAPAKRPRRIGAEEAIIYSAPCERRGLKRPTSGW